MPTSIYITESLAATTNIVLLVVTSGVSLFRMEISFYTKRIPDWEDCFYLMAFSCYITIAALYHDIDPQLFMLCDFILGRGGLWPMFVDDFTPLIKKLFVCINQFAVLLYPVKISILCSYKNVFSRLRIRTALWWTSLVFCFLVSTSLHICSG